MAGQFGGYITPLNVPTGGGSVSSGDVAPGSVTSGVVASGAVTGQAGGGYFVIASGTITTNDIGSGAIVSGLIASGQLSTYSFASGATIARAQFVAPVYSGTAWSLLTEETISGVRAVCISQSGNLRVAMAAVSGRMPAVGVIIDDVVSGIRANVYTQGVIQFTSGLFSALSHFGEPVWVGRSGNLVVISGGLGSGGFASGDIGQKAGVALALGSGGVFLNLSMTTCSGGPLGFANGGVI